MICCIRNPLVVFPSYNSLIYTLNHATKPDFEYERDYLVWCRWLVKQYTLQMKRYYQILKQDCVNEGKVPIYIVRYEDLVME